jgi:hypothetical protein
MFKIVIFTSKKNQKIITQCSIEFMGDGNPWNNEKRVDNQIIKGIPIKSLKLQDNWNMIILYS